MSIDILNLLIMKLIANLNPNMYQYICITQNAKTLFNGKTSDKQFEIADVSDGKITIGIKYRLFPFVMETYNMDVEVKSNSAVIINDSMSVRKYRNVMTALLLLLAGLSFLVLHNDYAMSAWLAAAFILIACYVIMSVRYNRDFKKQFKIYVI